MPTINLKLKPFEVPTHVTIAMPPGRKQDGMKPLPTLALEDLDEETLNSLIEEFAQAVMTAAGKA
jgi:hypothetical protein